jgi:hypothetical protein
MEGFTPEELRLREIAKREDYAATLAALLGQLTAHPDVPMPYSISGAEVHIFATGVRSPREVLSAVRRAFPCRWDKRVWDGEKKAFFEMAGEWDGWLIIVTAYRDAVCKRVVTGTEMRPVEKVITPAVTETADEPVEIVEWVCEPVTAPAGTDVAA